MKEVYALYDDSLSGIDAIIAIAETEEGIRESYKMAKIFRRMCGLEPLAMVMVQLTDEEYKKLISH